MNNCVDKSLTMVHLVTSSTEIFRLAWNAGMILIDETVTRTIIFRALSVVL